MFSGSPISNEGYALEKIRALQDGSSLAAAESKKSQVKTVQQRRMVNGPGGVRSINSIHQQQAQHHHYHYLPNGPARRSKYDLPRKSLSKSYREPFSDPSLYSEGTTRSADGNSKMTLSAKAQFNLHLETTQTTTRIETTTLGSPTTRRLEAPPLAMDKRALNRHNNDSTDDSPTSSSDDQMALDELDYDPASPISTPEIETPSIETIRDFGINGGILGKGKGRQDLRVQLDLEVEVDVDLPVHPGNSIEISDDEEEYMEDETEEAMGVLGSRAREAMEMTNFWKDRYRDLMLMRLAMQGRSPPA